MSNKHTTLTSLFTAIANAIRGKTGSSESIIADNFPDAISKITTSGIDPSDATATADDIAKGKTAYVNGGKVTGNVDEITRVLSTTSGYLSTTTGNTRIVAKSKEQSSNTLFRKGSQWAVEFAPSAFGDATAADVAAGKTFTSTAGLKVTGTHECSAAPADPVLQSKTVTPTESQQTVSPDSGYDGLSSVTVEAIPDSYVQPSGTKQITANGTHDVADYASVEVNVPVEGLDTSEATSPASAGDIAKGKIAFVNGEKVTGTITTYTGAVTFKNSTVDIGSGIYLKQTITKDTLLRTGAEPSFFCDKSNFGDASAADVAKGKTFTSTAGLKVTGTYEGSGIQAQHITSASETITISGSGAVKVWGYGYKSAQHAGTTYAFVGDGYYSGIYGTPSKTSASFSISNGTLNGLPDGLTALDVLVTIGVS